MREFLSSRRRLRVFCSVVVGMAFSSLFLRLPFSPSLSRDTFPVFFVSLVIVGAILPDFLGFLLSDFIEDEERKRIAESGLVHPLLLALAPLPFCLFAFGAYILWHHVGFLGLAWGLGIGVWSHLLMDFFVSPSSAFLMRSLMEKLRGRLRVLLPRSGRGR